MPKGLTCVLGWRETGGLVRTEFSDAPFEIRGVPPWDGFLLLRPSLHSPPYTARIAYTLPVGGIIDRPSAHDVEGNVCTGVDFDEASLLAAVYAAQSIAGEEITATLEEAVMFSLEELGIDDIPPIVANYRWESLAVALFWRGEWVVYDGANFRVAPEPGWGMVSPKGGVVWGRRGPVVLPSSRTWA